MLNKDLIHKQFSLFSQMELESISPWQIFLEQREVQVCNLLKGTISISREMSRICTAVAGLAYTDYLLISGDSMKDMEQVKLGDITFRSASATKEGSPFTPFQLGEYFLKQISDLLLPTTGIFPVESSGVHGS